MPMALLNVPSLVLVLNTTLSAEMRAVGVWNTTLPLGDQLAGLDVHLQIVGEELLAGVGVPGSPSISTSRISRTRSASMRSNVNCLVFQPGSACARGVARDAAARPART